MAVKKVRDQVPAGEDFAVWLAKAEKPQPSWKTDGPPETWPQQWATETLQLASQCYDGIKISERHTVPADEKHPEHDEWQVTLPPNYDKRAEKIVQVELAKAGYRLAQLLQAIWP